MKKKVKDINTSNLNNKKNNNIFKKIIKIIIMLVIFIALIFGIGFGIYKLYTYFTNKQYVPYEEKMNTYGFSKLYNNKSSNSYEYVTKSEAIKMVIGAVLNSDDISMYMDSKEYNEYTNQQWVEYAKSLSLIEKDSINEANYNNKETLINILEYISSLNTNILDQEANSDVVVNIKNFNKFNEKEQYAIKDAISKNILDNIDKNFNGNKKVSKGMLNKIIIDYVEKNNLLTIDGEAINTNENTMPSNVADYPYVLESVDKSVYEIPNYSFLEAGGTAKELYTERKMYFEQIASNVENYFDILLNVDYNTIDAETLNSELEDLSVFEVLIGDVQKYVDYVKVNKIKITGSGKVQMPAIYSDGYKYRARTKIEYTIESSNTNKNLLYADFDNGEDVEYKIGKNIQIIDVPLASKMGTKDLFINIYPIIKSIAGNVQNIYAYDEDTSYEYDGGK